MDVVFDGLQISILICLIKPFTKLQLSLLLEDDGMSGPSKLEMANLIPFPYPVTDLYSVHAT